MTKALPEHVVAQRFSDRLVAKLDKTIRNQISHHLTQGRSLDIEVVRRDAIQCLDTILAEVAPGEL